MWHLRWVFCMERLPKVAVAWWKISDAGLWRLYSCHTGESTINLEMTNKVLTWKLSFYSCENLIPLLCLKAFICSFVGYHLTSVFLKYLQLFHMISLKGGNIWKSLLWKVKYKVPLLAGSWLCIDRYCRTFFFPTQENIAFILDSKAASLTGLDGWCKVTQNPN